MGDPAGLLLAFVVYPLWVGAGLADWACHRASGLATTAGLRENLLHWAMFVEMGLAIAATALLEVTAGVLLLALLAFLLHEATVAVDLHTTQPVRRIGTVEQMVHSFQEVLPLAAFVLLAVMHWDQALALVGRGEADPDFALRWKQPALPPQVLLAGGLAAALLNALPLAQETLACLRARRR